MQASGRMKAMALGSERLVEEVRAQTDIVDVISEYVPLKKSGRDFTGLCPFHPEKTPSFTVSREKQLFHCFGCKAGGDALTFVMRRESLPFREAVERLARRLGLDPGDYAPTPGERQRLKEREELLAVNRRAAEYFARCLKGSEGARARRYLEGRGLLPAVVDAFGLGYAPPGGAQAAFFAGTDAGVQAAVRCGLLSAAAGRREPLPRFWDRLMFPITDAAGRVIGFGGRRLAEADGRGPKYLNSPETPLFSKRRSLYALWQAREAMRREGHVLVVEGYTDVLALYQVGIQHSVASLGTAFTPEHAQLLRRYVAEAIIAFDADAAGEAAAERGLDVLKEAGLRVRVMVLPPGEDPDSFVRSHGAAAFRQAAAEALSLVEYRLRQALKGVSADAIEEKAAAVQRVVPILAQVESMVEREAYIARIAGQLQVSVAAVAADVERFETAGGRRTNPRNRLTAVGQTRGDSESWRRPADIRVQAERRAVVAAQRVLLRRMLEGPPGAAEVLGLVGESCFTDALLASGVRVAAELYRSGVAYTSEDVLCRMNDPEAAALRSAMADTPRLAGGELVPYARRLKGHEVRRWVHLLERSLAHHEQGDQETAGGSLHAVNQLLVQYKRLREGLRQKAHRTPESGLDGAVPIWSGSAGRGEVSQ